MHPSLSPLAIIVPRPNIPLALPRTPSRSPVAPHILLSPPAANRNSTDSWNSSNYDLDDPNAVWKEDQVRLLARTLDALPSHLITPFNGYVPPSNLLDKIARGISAAKGPNDWPHSIRATRVKLLELARHKAQEERRKVTIEEGVPLGELAYLGNASRERTPDPAEVLQVRTNTPSHTRRPLYRQSSMDFMGPDQSDRGESIARLSTRLQRHDRVLHHPYLRPSHSRNQSEHDKRPPSTPSSLAFNSSQRSRACKSTVSVSSTSTSSFGSPMSISAPLRPSSLRRASVLTLASEAHIDADIENVLENTDLRHSGGYPEPGIVAKAVAKAKRAPSCISGGNVASLPPATPAARPKKPRSSPVPAVASSRRVPANASSEMAQPVPLTPPNEPRLLGPDKTTPNHVSTQARKVRKGHKPQLSISSDEEEKMRSKTVKKLRTREPSWSIPLTSAARAQLPSLLLSPAFTVEKESSDSGRSSSSGIRSNISTSSTSSTDNDLSTASTETAATTVSISSTLSQAKHKVSKNPNLSIQVPALMSSPVDAKKPARRNATRNPSMFGHELPCPQRTPASPSRIPVSSPAPLSPPLSSAATVTSFSSASPTSEASRPRTLRRAARRISFGSVATNLLSPSESPRARDGETTALGSAFQLA